MKVRLYTLYVNILGMYTKRVCVMKVCIYRWYVYKKVYVLWKYEYTDGMCIKMLMFYEGMYVNIVCVYRRYVYKKGMCYEGMYILMICIYRRYVLYIKMVGIIKVFVLYEGMCT